jgi:hypothetical protein
LVNGDLMKGCRARRGHLNWQPRRSIVPSVPYERIWRQYYSTRNYIFAMSRTFQHPHLARRELLKSLARACLSWSRGAKFGVAFTTLQLRAVIDGYLGRMGRTVIPIPKYGPSGAIRDLSDDARQLPLGDPHAHH